MSLKNLFKQPKKMIKFDTISNFIKFIDDYKAVVSSGKKDAWSIFFRHKNLTFQLNCDGDNTYLTVLEYGLFKCDYQGNTDGALELITKLIEL